jgi:5,10-methylenetetrahydrofolate reductase
VLLTDGAVGDPEEENLRHLAANLAGDAGAAGEGGGTDVRRLVPFLTCKHSLEYCLWFADRARRHGLDTLTVVGGDTTDGSERCLPHSYLLRQRIRIRRPDLALGGWVNPHRDPVSQARYVVETDFSADYYLTQVVSHHDRPAIDRWLEAAAQNGIDLPAAWGVFYYRSGRRESLERLSAHFDVPVEAIAREFEAGATPEEVCARSIIALREAGAANVYLCNLGARKASRRLDAIRRAVDAAS